MADSFAGHISWGGRHCLSGLGMHYSRLCAFQCLHGEVSCYSDALSFKSWIIFIISINLMLVFSWASLRYLFILLNFIELFLLVFFKLLELLDEVYCCYLKYCVLGIFYVILIVNISIGLIFFFCVCVCMGIPPWSLTLFFVMSSGYENFFR